MHRSEFLKLLKAEFPHLKQSINAEFGLLHCEMSIFHCFVQDLLIRKDIDKVQKAFNLANNAFRLGNKQLRNAIDVSFVEGLRLKGQKWAWKLLSEPLKELHLEFHGRIYG